MYLIRLLFPFEAAKPGIPIPNRIPLVAIFLFFYGALTLHGQSARAYERAGDAATKLKDYGAAIQQYAVALERRTDNAELMWKYAESARLINAFPLAEKMYRQLTSREKRKKTNGLLNYRLGEVLKNQAKYTDAIAAFEQFVAEKPAVDPEYFNRAQVEIETCRWAQQQAGPPPQVQVLNLGKGVNSPYSDFAPFIAGDTVYFSSYRFDKRGDRKKPRAKLTKIMYAIRNGRAREMTRGFPSTDTAHVAHTALFGEGNFLFVNVCQNLNATDIRCDLYLTVRDIRGHWSAPQRLPEPINMPGTTTTQPAVSYDPVTEQLNLWFVSDRPGGRGGLDIWYTPLDTNWFCPCNVPVSYRKPFRMPHFEPPQNLSELNTPGNDVTPFFHAPTRQLYFSSDGRRGLGGYDIFQAPALDTGFGTPENAGPGLNTSYNDLYFVLRPDGLSGYLSSNRPGAQYLDEANKACCNDLFEVRYPEPLKPEQPLASTPAPTPRVPIERPMIPIEQLQDPDPVPTQLAEFVGLPLYFDNDEPDKRTRRTNTRKNYAETAQAYLQRQTEYREQFAKGLNETNRLQAEEQIDAFFENEIRRGYERLDQLCERASALSSLK